MRSTISRRVGSKQTSGAKTSETWEKVAAIGDDKFSDQQFRLSPRISHSTFQFKRYKPVTQIQIFISRPEWTVVTSETC